MEIKDVKPHVDHVNIDRINELPDELLTHVLSFLPTKESAATSVLCTRWKHLCTFVPDIDLSFDLPMNPVSDADRLFLDFLNLGSRLVLLRKQASIRKFRLELWWADEKLRMEIVALITAALSCNLQELEFFVGEDFFDEGLIFPRGIFSCKSLVTLKLVTYFEQAGLDVPDSVFLPNVKELHLSVRLVDEDSLPRLLQGCPLLEELSISFHCEDTPNVQAVNFSGGSMKKLQVKVSGGNCVIVVESKRLESLDYEFRLEFQDQGDSKIIINTPNLKYLAYHARPDGVNFIQNLNSLIGAKLEFVYADEITSLQHLNRVQGVESLCLPMQFLKASTLTRMEEKAVKRADVNDGDRIGNLPDDLLSHILSFLPTKESAATAVLSTRWKNLFASVPDIDLEFDDDSQFQSNALERYDLHRQFLDFLNLGNRLVSLRNGAPIRKFRLSLWWANEKFRVALNKLISAAISCNIQELEICVETSRYSKRLSPLVMFKSKTLTCLKLNWRQRVDLNVPKSVFLPNLKVLHLAVKLSRQDSIGRLIRACPLLQELCIHFHCPREKDGRRKVEVVDFSSASVEKLMLSFCGGACAIFIESNSLQSLEYQEYHHMERHGITINTPNLKYLAYHGPMVGVNFVQNLNFLVESKFGVGYVDQFRTEEVVKHLNRLRKVKLLCLQQHILEALSFTRDSLPTFKNLTRLELQAKLSLAVISDEVSQHARSWVALKRILENSPTLEALVFDQVIWCDILEPESFYLQVLPVCSINHLKEIEITEFKRREYEFKLVEYLLQNGNGLKKITLGGFLIPAACKRILSFRRCSKDCQIVLDELEIFWSSTSDECSYKTKPR